MTLPAQQPPVPPLPLLRQLQALDEEIPHMIERNKNRANAGKVHWGVAAPQIRALKDAQRTVRQMIAEQQAGSGGGA